MSDAPVPDLTRYEQRRAALQARVDAVARELHETGLTPTVARVRAALGGGSPNDLTPALRHWRTVVLPTLAPRDDGRLPGIPPALADLVRELWARALAAATVEQRAGPPVLERLRHAESHRALRAQLEDLRAQLTQADLAYGELRAQAARHAAIATESAGRARQAEARERTLLRELGIARARIAELEATAEIVSARKPTPRRPKVTVRARAPTTSHRPATRRVTARQPRQSTAKTARSSTAKRTRASKRQRSSA